MSYEARLELLLYEDMAELGLDASVGRVRTPMRCGHEYRFRL
jgi:hypothetical protein